MKQFIGCDMHKRFSVFVSMDEQGKTGKPVKVSNDSLELAEYLNKIPEGTPVAVEASGGWYWFEDRLEAAGLDVRLVNPLEAKKRMRGRNKTDELDAAGLAMLLRNGTLPEVWIPPAKLGDLRGLMRTRLALRHHTTTLKNRIHGAIRRYGQYESGEAKDLFKGRGRVQLSVYLGGLPEQTRIATRHEWALVDEVERHIEELEKQIRLSIGQIGYVRLLKSMPGVGDILAATIYLEIGDVTRFASAAHLAAYAGLTPTVHASGGKMHLGRTSAVANHFLKWAFVEAANCMVMNKHRLQGRHVVELYERLCKAKCHGKAAVAVGRHLAEASWWILTKKQQYREPAPAASVADSNNALSSKSMSSSENGSAR
jgi:transposase